MMYVCIGSLCLFRTKTTYDPETVLALFFVPNLEMQSHMQDSNLTAFESLFSQQSPVQTA